MVAWEALEIDMNVVTTVLKCLQTELFWPSSHFVPSDPIRLALAPDYDELGFTFFRVTIERKLQVPFPCEELDHMVRANWTLGQVVTTLANKVATGSPCE
jgi:hypothetical protein